MHTFKFAFLLKSSNDDVLETKDKLWKILRRPNKKVRGADVEKFRELNCDFPVVTGLYLCCFRWA